MEDWRSITPHYGLDESTLWHVLGICYMRPTRRHPIQRKTPQSKCKTWNWKLDIFNGLWWDVTESAIVVLWAPARPLHQPGEGDGFLAASTRGCGFDATGYWRNLQLIYFVLAAPASTRNPALRHSTLKLPPVHFDSSTYNTCVYMVVAAIFKISSAGGSIIRVLCRCVLARIRSRRMLSYVLKPSCADCVTLQVSYVRTTSMFYVVCFLFVTFSHTRPVSYTHLTLPTICSV